MGFFAPTLGEIPACSGGGARALVPRRGEQGELHSRDEVARLACPWARLKSNSSAPSEVPHPPKKIKKNKNKSNTGVEVRNPSFLGRIQSRLPSAGRDPSLPTCIDCAVTVERQR